MVEWGKQYPKSHYFTALISPDHKGDWHWGLLPFIIIWIGFAGLVLHRLFAIFCVPEPRKPTPSEKQYRTIDEHGKLTEPKDLPCWMDRSKEKWLAAQKEGKDFKISEYVEEPEVFMTLVIPAYNEEKRLIGMLEESVNLLEKEYGTSTTASTTNGTATSIKAQNGSALRNRKPDSHSTSSASSSTLRGWEILIVDDGSKDSTLQVAAEFIRSHSLPLPTSSSTQKPVHLRRASGPWTPGSSLSPSTPSTRIPIDAIRLIHLEKNRGKGGAVTHGMRHARGQYVLFADADGASDIRSLSSLVTACSASSDSQRRAVAVGSRAHMVSSPSVVQRSPLRNFLMHGFHLFLYLMTPRKTAQVKDTQCGFKLFSRQSLPYIVPHMHMEGWIFDVEMLMLAEWSGIPIVEVPVGWKEVGGSKLNVVWDSLGMAWGLGVLRIAWGTGIYS